MKAVVMCAGKGTRLGIHTKDKPKCMVRILSKPIIKWTYNTLKEIGIEDIVIISGYMQNVLFDYARDNLKGCTFITQHNLTGTADAIYLAKEHMDDDFLVLSGDIIYDKCSLMKIRQIKNSLLYCKQETKLEEFGTLDLKGDRIMHINEKSTEPTSNFVNCAAYHFTPEIFDYIPKTDIDTRFNERIITNTINLMINDGTTFSGIEIKERNEISHPEDIETVESRFKVKLTPEEEKIITDRLKQLGYME